MLCKEKKKLIIHEINTLEMRSVPSLSSIVGTGHGRLSLRVLHFELCYRGTSFKVRGFGKCVDFLAHNYISEQSANQVEYGMPSKSV